MLHCRNAKDQHTGECRLRGSCTGVLLPPECNADVCRPPTWMLNAARISRSKVETAMKLLQEARNLSRGSAVTAKDKTVDWYIQQQQTGGQVMSDPSRWRP